MVKFLAFFKQFSRYCLCSSLLWGLLPASVQAYEFSSQEVEQENFIAIAAPIGQSTGYNLLLLEQLDANGPECWAENKGQPTLVEPLLLNFDFTGICSRSTDSSGYSLRVNGQDLDWNYKLTLVRGFQQLKLIAIENTNNYPRSEIEIGSTDGLSNGNFLKINLNPGWRFTKQVYQGNTLNHTYFTNNETLSNLARIPTLLTARGQTPTNPSPNNNTLTSSMATVATPNNLEVPGLPKVSNSVVVPPPPNFNFATSSSFVSVPSLSATNALRPNHRVVVRANQSQEQKAVKAIVPDAFIVNLGSQVYLQVGAFDSEEAANSFRDRFRNEGFNTKILNY
ncbi:MAG: DUF3747 domain-containing protein [Synechococcaceae cyanobacterium RL_1_2]|nr:DUF3747 domain-containing protein [Synechococcaceae cyanobacterium RL_1_2]